MLRAGAEERTAGGASLLRGRPARHHPATEPSRSQAHQNRNRLFFFSYRVRCVVGYSFGLEGAAWLSRVRRGRPARHHPATEPSRSQAHQNLSRLFVFSNRVRCVVGYSFGLEGAAWLSRVRRGIEGAAWLSRVRCGRPPRHHPAAGPSRSQAHQNLKGSG